MIEQRHIVPATLELRRGGRRLSGSFPYGKTATVSDRGTRRKERIESHAFEFSVKDKKQEINLLGGHSFNQPLASKLAGSLVLKDTREALLFHTDLPEEGEMPTWMLDVVKAIRLKLATGLSPGFVVPPALVVPGAEKFIPEPGNPSVQIRVLTQLRLLELSIVTRAAYTEAGVSLRADQRPYSAWKARRGVLWL